MARRLIALLCLALASCSTMQFTPAAQDVAVFYEYPQEQYRSLGMIDYDYYQPGFREPTVTDALPDLKAKALEAGGNALVIRHSKIGERNNRFITVTAEVLRLERMQPH